MNNDRNKKNQSKSFIATKVPFRWITGSKYTFVDHKNHTIIRATGGIQPSFIYLIIYFIGVIFLGIFILGLVPVGYRSSISSFLFFLLVVGILVGSGLIMKYLNEFFIFSITDNQGNLLGRVFGDWRLSRWEITNLDYMSNETVNLHLHRDHKGTITTAHDTFSINPNRRSKSYYTHAPTKFEVYNSKNNLSFSISGASRWIWEKYSYNFTDFQGKLSPFIISTILICIAERYWVKKGHNTLYGFTYGFREVKQSTTSKPKSSYYSQTRRNDNKTTQFPQQSNKCPKCFLSQKDNYTYCKRCGTKLLSKTETTKSQIVSKTFPKPIPKTFTKKGFNQDKEEDIYTPIEGSVDRTPDSLEYDIKSLETYKYQSENKYLSGVEIPSSRDTGDSDTEDAIIIESSSPDIDDIESDLNIAGEKKSLFSSIQYQVQAIDFEQFRDSSIVNILPYSGTIRKIIVKFDNSQIIMSGCMKRPSLPEVVLKAKIDRDPQPASWDKPWDDIFLEGEEKIIQRLKHRYEIAHHLSSLGKTMLEAKSPSKGEICISITCIESEEAIKFAFSLLRDLQSFFEISFY